MPVFSGKAEREKQAFVDAIFEVLEHTPQGKFVQFRCPICGELGLCVKLEERDRRGACVCGRRYIEPRE